MTENWWLKKNKKPPKFTGYIKPLKSHNTAPKREKRVSKTGTQKTVKQLLGELYADKVYLEKLLEDDRKIYSNKETVLTPSTSKFWN